MWVCNEVENNLFNFNSGGTNRVNAKYSKFFVKICTQTEKKNV